MGNWSFGLEQAADSWEYSNMKTKYIYALVAILAMLIGCSSVPRVPAAAEAPRACTAQRGTRSRSGNPCRPCSRGAASSEPPWSLRSSLAVPAIVRRPLCRCPPQPTCADNSSWEGTGHPEHNTSLAPWPATHSACEGAAPHRPPAQPTSANRSKVAFEQPSPSRRRCA